MGPATSLRAKVASPINPGDETFDAASSRLNAGLRSCRSVLSNYRALLTADRDELSRAVCFTEPHRSREQAAD